MPRPAPKRKDCTHCKTRSGCRPGGLCNTCYQDLSIRHQYVKRIKAQDKEPTSEEVEQTIREQMQCLPWWWESEREKELMRE